MLRIRRWQRLASPVLALWFAVFIGESAWLNACPMHGASAMAGGKTSRQAHDGDAHGAEHAPPAATGARPHHDARDSAPTDAPPEHSPCNCLGHCLGAAIHALAPRPVRLQLVEPERASAVASTAPGRPPYRRAHQLPFATAPPAAHAAA